jgi:hypothetical protein
MKRKTTPAELVSLSPSTEAVISKRGVTFIRGSSAWRLSDTETKKLVEALKPEETE